MRSMRERIASMKMVDAMSLTGRAATQTLSQMGMVLPEWQHFADFEAIVLPPLFPPVRSRGCLGC